MASNTRLITVLFVLVCTLTAEAQIQPALPVSKESEVDIKSYSGIISEQYANGSPFVWKTLKNGKAEGLWLEWYPNGNLRYRALWGNGLGNGKWEYFYPNGQLRSESFYIDDIAQGIYRSYHQNGQLESDETYRNGKKDGLSFIYDENGTLLTRQRFENGNSVIDEPVVFEEDVLSSPLSNEWGIHFTPDGNTAYFTRRDAESKQKRIYKSQKENGRWSKPLIASFSIGEDESPYLDQQGEKLFFASYRPLPDGSTTAPMDMNIWVMNKIKEGWSSPKPLPKVINQSMTAGDTWPANYEAGPMTDSAGNLYYWTKGTKNNGTNLYFSALNTDGSYAEPVELIEPSSHTNYDSAPHLSADGNLLFFASDDRYDGFGGTDIYYSKKIKGQWSKPKNLGPTINSSRDDSFPSLSPDGKYFFFSSNRGNQKDADGAYLWDIYYVESKFLIID